MVERANACYKEELARLEAEKKHLLRILETHKPLCQLQIGNPGYQSYWTNPNTGNITGLEHEKIIVENADNYIVNKVDTYENSDNLVETRIKDESVSYPSYSYPGFSSGYYGSACAAV